MISLDDQRSYVKWTDDCFSIRFLILIITTTIILFFIVNTNLINLCMIGQLNVVDGKRQYLFDDEGRRYLDGFGGIATVGCGHCHPDVVEAIVNQTKRLQHSTVLYLNSAIADFAEALASKLPGDLNVHTIIYYFVTSNYSIFRE